jgi:hypothetical protein
MNPMPLEYRIVAALLLGSATAIELGQMLTEAWEDCWDALKALGYSRVVSYSFEPPCRIVYELTQQGRQWAQDMIK